MESCYVINYMITVALRWIMKRKNVTIFFLICAFWLASCSLLPDTGEEEPTEVPIAAATTEVVIPPSATPVPTKTPLATLFPGVTPTIIPGDSTPTPDPNCVYDAAFVYDVSVPDDTVIPPAVNFDKTWRMINTGTCRWLPGTYLIYVDGTQMGDNTRVPITPADPGEVIDVSVKLLAPDKPGTYTSYWHLQLPSGEIIETEFFTRVIVPIATATRPPRPTTSSSGGDGSGDSTSDSDATSTPTVVPTTSSWVGKFYANTTLSGDPILQTEDSSVNFDWGTGSPSAEVPVDNFSATWSRTLNFDLGTYQFNATADDGVRVYVDDTLVIDEWHEATANTYTAEVSLSAGAHEIKVDFYEGTGDAKINVWWTQAVTTSSSWSAEYYSTQDLSGTVTLARNEPSVNFDWGLNSPDSSIPVDGFSARWTRALTFNAGTYEFQATMDDGMRVYIDESLVLNEWNEGGERTVTFEQVLTSGTHVIKVEYFEVVSDAVAKLTWEEKGSTTTTSGNWTAEFFNNTDLSGSPVLTKEYASLNFNWGQNAPENGVNADNFSVRFTRSKDFAEGEHKFYATADDGVRVIVNGNIVIDKWDGSGSQPYSSSNISLNGTTEVIVEYVDLAVSAKVNVWSEKQN
jgi:hypothetical protein